MHRAGFALVAASLLTAAAVLPLDAPPLSLFACPFRAATGLPCLTCGCTHAFHFFVRGQLAQAFLSSPLGFFLALGCAVYVVLTLCGVKLRAPDVPGRVVRWTAAGAVALNWLFLVVRGAP